MEETHEFKNNTDILSDLAQSEVGSQLARHFSTLQKLGAASIDQLISVPGIGPSRARAIKAAYTLAVRLKRETYSRKLLDSPESVAELLREEAAIANQELAYLVMLDSRNRMIRLDQIAIGTLDSVLIHPREIYAPALQARSSSIILAHTHPSGDPSPSQTDIKITKEIERAGQLLRIPLLDHIIIGYRSDAFPSGYVSLRELGYI